MVKTNLAEEEKGIIIEALNNNTEAPPELMTKLPPVWLKNSMRPNWTEPKS